MFSHLVSRSVFFIVLLLSQIASANAVCEDPEPTNPNPAVFASSNPVSTSVQQEFGATATTCVEIEEVDANVLVEAVSASGSAAKMIVRATGDYSTTDVNNATLQVGDQRSSIVLHPIAGSSGSFADDHAFVLPLAVDTGVSSGNFHVRITLRSGATVLRVIDSQSVTVQ